jgi:hypothetical protein
MTDLRASSLAAVLSVGLTAGLAAVVPAQAQLQFAGSAAVGASVELAVAGGPAGGSMAVLLSPTVGQARIGSFETDCFALSAAGLVWLDLPLSAQGAARLRIPIPAAASLAGVYLAGLGLAIAPGAPRTNCASFLIVPAAAGPELLETFDDRAGAAPDLAAFDWAGSVRGAARPGRVGGSGRLGSFDPGLGTPVGGVMVFRTEDQLIPGSATLSGAPLRVTDGVFEFLDFAIPAGVAVRFEGPFPARILVAGDARIDGVLDVSASDLEVGDGTPGLERGQAGGPGGAGAGAGGAGGDLPSLAAGLVDGQPGEDLRAPPGGAHALSTGGSGGRGSPAWPVAADPAAVRYAFFGFYSNQIAGGGGGGGHLAPGGSGRILAERPPTGGSGISGSGGAALGPPGTRSGSRADLLIAGAGGGGAGVHPYDSLAPQVVWTRGGGGGGGGGALLLAVGGDLTIGPAAALRADGGAGSARTDQHGAFLAPGGGGSGGTILVQVGGVFRNDGEVSARGGAGGRTEDLRLTLGTAVAGGDGAPGRIRVEGRLEPGLGGFEPPVEVGVLDDRDPWTLGASVWRSVPPGADPSALRYELHSVQDALPVVYSDEPGAGVGPARRGSAPVLLWTRFGQRDALGQLVPGTVGPWTEGSAAAEPGANAVQFLIGFDRGLSGPAADLRVETVRLRF